MALLERDKITHDGIVHVSEHCGSNEFPSMAVSRHGSMVPVLLYSPRRLAEEWQSVL